MHIAIGGEHTPYTCRTFPRFINDFGGTREMGISFSCPVASDMMWNLDEDFDFNTEINALPPSINDIDADVYFKLLTYRKTAYSIVQNKNNSIKERLIQLLDFAVKIQAELDHSTENASYTDFFDIFDNPEVINQEWVEKVQKHNIQPIFPDDKICENIAMYFIFRYFLTAVYDNDVLSKVKMAVIGVLIPAYFGNDSWTIHLWSKETEHSDINMNRYKYELKSNINLTAEQLKKHLI